MLGLKKVIWAVGAIQIFEVKDFLYKGIFLNEIKKRNLLVKPDLVCLVTG